MSILNEMNGFYYHMALYELQIMNDDNSFKGISYNTILYINVIDQTKECTVSKLANQLKITKSAVTLKINEMEKAGIIVKKQSDKDRRIFYIEMSEATKNNLALYDQVFMKIEKKLKELYTEEQLALFNQILNKISSYEWKELENE